MKNWFLVKKYLKHGQGNCGSCTQAKSDQVGNFESVKMSLSDDILFKELVQNFSHGLSSFIIAVSST